MVGVYYHTDPLPLPNTCPQCGLQHARTYRTIHICGVSLLPLGSQDDVVCYQCGFHQPLEGQNMYYPGRRMWRRRRWGWRSSHRAMYDRRQQWTTYFWGGQPRMFRWRRAWPP